MGNTLKKLDFLRHSMLFPRYSFNGLDFVDFNLQPKEKLSIYFDEKAFLLSNEGNGNFRLDSVNGEQTTTTLNSENKVFEEKAEDGTGFFILADEGAVQIVGGGDLMVIGPNVVHDVKNYKAKGKNKREPMGGHLVGNLYDPTTGHVIDGGRLFSDSKDGIKPPYILIDFERDVELKKAYDNIVNSLELNNPNKKEMISEETILQRVFDEFKDLKYLYDENPLKEKLKGIRRGLRVGPLVKRLGGICCYQAFVVCAILEKLILDKHLSGRVFDAGAKNHGWPFYISANKDMYVLDSTQGCFANITKNPDKTFWGSEEIGGKKVKNQFKYLDFLPEELTIWKHF